MRYGEDVVDIPGECESQGEPDAPGAEEQWKDRRNDLRYSFLLVPRVGHDEVARNAAGQDRGEQGCEVNDRHQ